MKDNVPFLEIKHLVVEYTSGGAVIHAVNGVNLTLNKGETLGLVGETGAGKTTVAKAVLRVLPDPPAKIRGGEINLNGENILSVSEKEMRGIRGKKVSMIFQDPMTALNPVMTIGSQIAEVIRIHNQVSAAEADVKAMKMLEMVGIPAERFPEYPHQFSGGMKQRIVIAIALACQPQLLIADEPTTALDVTIQAQILKLMENLKNELGTSMIMITHDLGVVAETCDKVAVMYAGEIVEYGTARDIFDPGDHHPYTVGLFNAIPNLDEKTDRLHPIDGLMPDPTNLPAGCKFSPRCPYCTEECVNGTPYTYEEDGHRIFCNRFRKEG